MKPPGKPEEKKPNNEQSIRWYRRRYRERIWFLPAEVWLMLSFSLLALGASLLSAHFLVPDGSESDREVVFKLGAFLLLSGWSAFIFLVETVKSRNGQRTFFLDPNPPFAGVSIPPSPQPEWLSSALLPEIEREWVLVEAEPWFGPGDEIAQPPTISVANKDGDEPQLSASKKRRNRKKKNANQNSEFGGPEQSNEASGEIEDQIAIVEPDGSNPDLQGDEQLLTLKKEDIDKENNYASDGDAQEGSIQVADNPNDSHQTLDHSKDSHTTSGQLKDPRAMSGHSKDSHATSGHSKDSHATSGQSKDPDQPCGGILPEISNETSTKTTVSNPISSDDMSDDSKQLFTHTKVSNEASVGDNPEQLNKASIQSEDSNETDEMQPVDSNPVFSHSKSKKRKHKRKR